MAIQPVYLVAAKNLAQFLEALRHAQAPDKIGLRFVEELGFKSTNDRLFIPLLKALRFLDESGKPTARYHTFLDDSEWKRVLAAGIRDAYSDLFRINKNAQSLGREQIAGKIKSLGEGKLSPTVVGNMTKTFLELVKHADFSSGEASEEATVDATNKDGDPADSPSEAADAVVPQTGITSPALATAASLVYRIEIVLPAVRDQAVYDAIFRSARQHLLG